MVMASYFVLARGLGLEIPLIDLIALLPPVLLVSALPISVNGWGVREAAVVGMLGFVGVPVDAALTLSVVQGLVTAASRLPGGVAWLLPNILKEPKSEMAAKYIAGRSDTGAP